MNLQNLSEEFKISAKKDSLEKNRRLFYADWMSKRNVLGQTPFPESDQTSEFWKG